MNASVSTGLSEAARLSMAQGQAAERVMPALAAAGVKSLKANHEGLSPTVAKTAVDALNPLNAIKVGMPAPNPLGIKSSPIKMDPNIASVSPNQIFNVQSSSSSAGVGPSGP